MRCFGSLLQDRRPKEARDSVDGRSNDTGAVAPFQGTQSTVYLVSYLLMFISDHLDEAPAASALSDGKHNTNNSIGLSYRITLFLRCTCFKRVRTFYSPARNYSSTTVGPRRALVRYVGCKHQLHRVARSCSYDSLRYFHGFLRDTLLDSDRGFYGADLQDLNELFTFPQY